MRKTSLLAALIPLSLAAAGCGGLGSELTDVICECTRCDDWKEEKLLAAYDTSREVAEIYGCDVEWEALMECEIAEGECDDENASWSVFEKENCDQNMCGGSGAPCQSDSDCPATDDRCDSEREDLFECEDDSADDKTYIGGGGVSSSDSDTN